MQAQTRFNKGLAGLPARRKKIGKQTVMLTKELFRFESIPGKSNQDRLLLGTDKFPVGELRFKAHREYGLPNTITISRQNGEWHISFNYTVVDEAKELLTEQELVDYFCSLTREELEVITVGGDRGVVIPLATSDGITHGFTDREKAVLAAKEKARIRYQRRMARQKEGSKRILHTRSKIDKTYTKQRNIRHDRAHKISRALVDSAAKVFVFEDLKVKNMTRRAKPKQDDSGKYIRNGAAAKSWLNKAMLRSMWGNITLFTKYKALQLEKLTIRIPAPGTSQECCLCGHIHPDNRETQSLFVCTRCGFTGNADYNAALVIKKRGITALFNGEIKVKQKKTTKFTKSSTRGGTPGVMRVDMDSSTLSGAVANASAQEAIVSRLAGSCLPDAGAGESRSSHLNHVSG
jgi:putative transposase